MFLRDIGGGLAGRIERIDAGDTRDASSGSLRDKQTSSVKNTRGAIVLRVLILCGSMKGARPNASAQERRQGPNYAWFAPKTFIIKQSRHLRDYGHVDVKTANSILAVSGRHKADFPEESGT